MISARTKAALEAAKRRGAKLGGFRGFVFRAKDHAAAAAARREKAQARAADLAPVVQKLQASGSMKLTRFRGHPNICVQGAHDGISERAGEPIDLVN
jgi:DNA invertase Pin-like site-specific DNA recombinase